VTVTDLCKVLIFGSNAAGGVADACSGTNPACTITQGYAIAYSTYCALACFSGVKSGTGAIDAHATSTYTSAVSSGHAVALTPAAAPIDLIPAEGTQTQAADVPAITQVHNLVTAEGYQTQLADSPALTQVHALVPAEGYQTQLSDPADLEQFAPAIDLYPAEGIQTQGSDAPALTQTHILAAQEGMQA
jgi:hypothetical protein